MIINAVINGSTRQIVCYYHNSSVPFRSHLPQNHQISGYPLCRHNNTWTYERYYIHYLCIWIRMVFGKQWVISPLHLPWNAFVCVVMSINITNRTRHIPTERSVCFPLFELLLLPKTWSICNCEESYSHIKLSTRTEGRII